jgi:hypothetical protein
MSPESSIEPVGADELKEIFGFLEKNFHSGIGRGCVPEELQRRMEQFADGLIPEGEIEALCAQILREPGSIRAFAEILARRSPEGEA